MKYQTKRGLNQERVQNQEEDFIINNFFIFYVLAHNMNFSSVIKKTKKTIIIQLMCNRSENGKQL